MAGALWRAGVVVAALGGSLWASYFWQAHELNWAMAAAFLAGASAIGLVERRFGASAPAAVGRGLVRAGAPILLMLLTFNYFRQGFLLIRANRAAAAATGISGDLYKATEEERRAAAPKLVAALEDKDLFVRWGALYKLWGCGQTCEGAALPVARAVVATAADPVSAPREYLRRGGLRLLRSRKADGAEGLLLVRREGDAELRRDAEYALKELGVPLPEPRP